MSAREVYETTGDAAEALKLLLLSQKKETDKKNKDAYNTFLCQSMVSERGLSLEWLEELKTKEKTAPKLKEQETLTNWILIYNRGLTFLSLHKPNDAWDLVWPVFEQTIINDKKFLKDDSYGNEELIDVACHMAVLLLQSVLEPNFTASVVSNASVIMEWLQNAVTTQAPLKFLLALTKSQMELSSSSINENNIRSARKELKHAMEIFQHKLKTPENENTAKITNNESSALNLKANTERLKGNVKKSLVLLAEAKTDDAETLSDQQPPSINSNLDQMHHYNNLALVYHTNEKPHLALHAWSKALSFSTSSNTQTAPQAILQPNGTAKSNGQTNVLFNASITCLQQQNYRSAYECMALVVPRWKQRADCWLRLAEACIGWNAQQISRNSGNFQTTSNQQGEPDGIILETPSDSSESSFTLAVLGSPQDMEQLEKNPLPRAHSCLLQTLEILHGKKMTDREEIVQLAARLSLSYVCLELRDYAEALKLADLVLVSAPKLAIISSSSVTEDGKSNESDDASSRVLKSTIQRQQATARMYASEAACALGDAATSMKYLVGDNEKNDAIDRLASDLAGVTLEAASNHPQGKKRLAKAQAMVRCNASAVTANLNHLAPAKQLAMSAQAMEGAYMSATTEESSYARRILVYCMLREGNTAAALTLLRSSR